MNLPQLLWITSLITINCPTVHKLMKNTNSRTCPHSESRVTQSAKSGSSWELRGAQLSRREGLADCSHLWAQATLLCHPTYRQMSSESAQFFKCSNCDAFTHRKIALFVINYSIYFKAKSWPSKLKPMNSFSKFFYHFFIWKLISYLILQTLFLWNMWHYVSNNKFWNGK